MVIISIIILNFFGCGYKKAPYYEEKIKVDDKVDVIIKKSDK